MSGLRRPKPANHIVELAKKLAEEYPLIAMQEVSRVVHEAADTVIGTDGEATLTKGNLSELLETIAQVARTDLDWLRTDNHQRHPVMTEPTAPARQVGLRHAPHRGAA